MKSKITPGDFFCITEMMSQDNVGLRMNTLTYKKIIGLTFGDNEYVKITNIQSKLNGLKIEFDESKKDNCVSIIANYIPHTSESVEIEIL